MLIRHILVKKNIVMYIQQWQDEHHGSSCSTTVTSSKITVKMSKLFKVILSSSTYSIHIILNKYCAIRKMHKRLWS